MRDKDGKPMRVYGRPPRGGLLAYAVLFLVLLSLFVWAAWKLNEILFLW